MSYTNLACAIISQAFKDLTSKNPDPKAYHTAKEFLCVSNPDLKFWCSIGDVDMNAIVKRSQLALISQEIVDWRGKSGGSQILGEQHSLEVPTKDSEWSDDLEGYPL